MTALAVESALTDLPDRLVVSPGYGRVAASSAAIFTTEGEVVRAGDLLAVISAGAERREVRAPCDAWVLRMLVREGEQVQPGTPVYHLRAL